MVKVGVRSQESGVRRNENYIEGSRKNSPLIFLPLYAQNPNFLSFLDRKAFTFFDPKRRKPLSVNALRVNQQALDNFYTALRIKVFDIDTSSKSCFSQLLPS
ncbi:MAG: hypothetical protein F6K50_07850 [Moorea sp. SIO3I7]|uniref:hypothetical protein n=1 Tax=Moorena sp. SIO3I8 TaxID=2607833 RepID=UPI0013C00C85|nr:hypothetical protein [Moorena sp. SIO3I8]NEN95440.1 hypothetical protein [Moorena sp. SIO3I7]NEO05414.1 hypothetical protein [Moorena sp. SIO3I8]